MFSKCIRAYQNNSRVLTIFSSRIVTNYVFIGLIPNLDLNIHFITKMNSFGEDKPNKFVKEFYFIKAKKNPIFMKLHREIQKIQTKLQCK